MFQEKLGSNVIDGCFNLRQNIFNNYMFLLMCLLFHLIFVVSCFNADIMRNGCLNNYDSEGLMAKLLCKSTFSIS